VATLKEVALRAQVSTATVSKVLSNTPYVSEETRARVLRAVAELGYVPNLAARALSKGRTYIIGVVFPYNYDHLFADPLITTILEGIETVCTEQGYNVLIVTPRAPVIESAQYQRLAQSGYLDGLITIETLPDTPASTIPEQLGYPWVALGYRSALGNLNTIQSDDFAGAKEIAAYLIGLGHRHMGIITVEETDLAAAARRMSGYRSAFENAALNFDQVPCERGSFSVESGYQAADKLLARTPHPTAILCLNDRMAIGAIQRVWAAGLQVPQDISVVGFDDIPSAAYFAPALTTVRQHAEEMGERAAQMLFEIIGQRASDNRRGTTQTPSGFKPIVFPSELVIRSSAAPPPGRSLESLRR